MRVRDHLIGVLLAILPPEVVPDVVFVVLPDALVDRLDDGVTLMGCGVSLGGGSVGRTRIGSVGFMNGAAVTRSTG